MRLRRAWGLCPQTPNFAFNRVAQTTKEEKRAYKDFVQRQTRKQAMEAVKCFAGAIAVVMITLAVMAQDRGEAKALSAVQADADRSVRALPHLFDAVAAVDVRRALAKCNCG